MLCDLALGQCACSRPGSRARLASAVVLQFSRAGSKHRGARRGTLRKPSPPRPRLRANEPLHGRGWCLLGCWTVGNVTVLFEPHLLLCVHTTSKVYSCSVDGTVLAWNVSSLRVTSRFQLPGGRLSSISLHDGHLWCCKSSVPCRPLPQEEGTERKLTAYFLGRAPSQPFNSDPSSVLAGSLLPSCVCGSLGLPPPRQPGRQPPFHPLPLSLSCSPWALLGAGLQPTCPQESSLLLPGALCGPGTLCVAHVPPAQGERGRACRVRLRTDVGPECLWSWAGRPARGGVGGGGQGGAAAGPRA